MSIARFWSPAILLVFVATGCRHAPPAVAPEQSRPAPPVVQAAPPAPAPPPRAPAPTPPPPLTDAERFARMSLDALNASHPLGDVFFDYDANTLREDAKRTLQSDADWLMKWPTTVLRIDGSCDERGTAEYNLALGDRRAVVAKAYLAGLGVPTGRIEVRSLGKDAPYCHESDESCWQLNRRGHMAITAK